MEIRFWPLECREGQVAALAAGDMPGIHELDAAFLPQAARLTAGWTLAPESAPETPVFRVAGRAWIPDAGGTARSRPLLEALAPVTSRRAQCYRASRQGFAAAWITLSDKGASGQRRDEAGPLIAEMLAGALPLSLCRGWLIPDEPLVLRTLLSDLALHQGYDLICTTGGTGLAPRDRTPEATEKVIDYPVPGLSQAMMAASLEATPRAALSRAVAGVAGRALILNLPGSPRAVRENLEAVLPALGHALEKLRGDPSDCGQG